MIQIFPINSIISVFIAITLFLPLAKQALRLRSVISKSSLAESSVNSISQARYVSLLVYYVLAAAALIFGAAMIYFYGDENIVVVIGVGIFVVGVLMLILSSVVKKKIDIFLFEFSD